MKQFHFLLNIKQYVRVCLVCLLCLLSNSEVKAQLYSKAPDFVATLVYKEIYYDYVTNISSKVLNGELEVYTDPSLTSPLLLADRSAFLTEIFYIEDIDENTGEIETREIIDVLQGGSWEGIHYDLTYIVLKINERKTLYLPNSEKARLNKNSTLLLEKLQTETRIPWISSQSIEENGYLVYDGLQEKIYAAIESGKLKMHRVDSTELSLSFTMFDSFYKTVEPFVIIDETGQEVYVESVSKFSPYAITGCSFRGQLTKSNDGWHIACEFYGIMYRPLASGFELPSQTMCLIKREDMNRFLKADDTLLFQEIWNFTLREKIQQPLNEDAY